MDKPLELTLEELRERIQAAGVTIPDHRLGMVRKLLNDKLAVVEDGVLDPAVVGDQISAASYWGVYAKA